VLYDNTESAVRLSPIYDLVTTTAYNSLDILALTLGGTKRWPKAKALVAFARTHCNLTEARAKELLAEVSKGVLKAANEATLYMHNNTSFRDVGALMLAEWNKGLNLSIQPEGQLETMADCALQGSRQ
jgi:serine/threonine-protein kinase HipA